MLRRIFIRFSRSYRIAYWSNFFRTARAHAEKLIPKIELGPVNLNNLKTLSNREELLKNMPANKVVAEIGVDHGDFSAMIMAITSPAKLHLIDAWSQGNRYHAGLKAIVEQKFEAEINNGTVNLDVGLSTDRLSNYEDNYFDWVYLDTDHSYKTTKAELSILKIKVKPGGIIAGHDYIIGNWVDGYRYGVIEAVNEFCVNEKWEMIYLTAETDQYRSFAIKKINV